MEQSRVRYEIAYSKTAQTVAVYPQWRGARPNFQVIGDFTPENPRGEFDEYRSELGEAIRHALARVGELDPEPFKITIVPLDGSDEFTPKEWGGPLKRVPLEDQVPVSANKTVAQATAEELENGTPEPHASQVSQEVAKVTEDEEAKPGKKAASKTSSKKS